MSDAKLPLALYLQAESDFGQSMLRGYVALVQPDGELRNPDWFYGGFKHGAEYDGLQVAAYVGESSAIFTTPVADGVWGMSVTYNIRRIESARHAKAIAGVLGKLERAMHRMNSDNGYLAQDDFAGYVLRIASILKMRIYVRNSHEVRDRTGEQFRRVNGSSLQLWVDTVVRDIAEGKIGLHVRA